MFFSMNSPAKKGKTVTISHPLPCADGPVPDCQSWPIAAGLDVNPPRRPDSEVGSHCRRHHFLTVQAKWTITIFYMVNSSLFNR